MDLTQLHDLPLFGQLTAAECRVLDPFTWLREYPPQTAILTQGETSGGFHVIVSGSVQVLLGDEPRMQMATLGPGEYFGEIAAVTGEEHGATVETLAPTVTVEFSRDGLLTLLRCSATLNQHVLETLARRVKRTNRRAQEAHRREVALARYVSDLEAARKGDLVGFSPAGQQLVAAVAALARTVEPVLLVGESGCGKEHVAARIHWQGPRQHQPLVTLHGSEWSLPAWQQHLRLAEGGTLLLKDLHLLPAAGAYTVLDWLRHTAHAAGDAARFIGTYTVREARAADPLPPPFDPAALAACRCRLQHLPPLRERREDIPALVLCFLRQAHRQATDDSLGDVIRPDALRLLCAYPYLQGNIKELAEVMREAAVLAGDGPIGAEHLRLGRYRRREERPTVGLALGGGVVRGIAHVGVLKVLAAEGIPIDAIAGTSAGAMVGGLYAGGLSPAELEHVALHMGWWDLIRPVLPRRAVVHNQPTARFVQRQIGHCTFTQTRIPFAAVAADAVTGEPVVLREGRLSAAIRASTAIPTLVRPVPHGQRRLMDGFVVSSVPVLVARSLGADLVVGVDLGQPDPDAAEPGNLWFSLLRTLDILSRRQVERELDFADAVMTVLETGISAYSFRNARRFLQAGEEAARQQLPRIRQRLVELAADRV